MDKILPELYSIYGKYINQFRSFPFILDGCKLAERRILVSTFEVAPKHFEKSAGIIGHCIKSYHPHGECLHYDTEIPLLDGTIKTIGWLAENWTDKEFWIYSCKPDGTIVPGLAHHPRPTKVTDIMYKITLDNGKVIETTDNHPYMERDGNYIKAKDLKVGDSLMPLNLSSVDGYTFCPSGNEIKKTSVMVAEGYNHRVIKVERIVLDKPIQFYDLSVEKWNNFGINNGVFVHNSIYDVLVRLVNNKFLDDTQGNWGLKIGIKEEPPAAMRYTETRMTKWLTDLSFEYISYIDKDNIEYKDEVPFLPTKLPICLLGLENTQGIGFGYRTNIPVYKREDLIKRLSWLLGYVKKEPIIKPLTDCKDCTTDIEHQKILSTGKGKMDLKGIYITDDKSVIVKSWPSSKQWTSIESKFQSFIEIEKAVGIIDETNGKNGCQIRFLIKRQRGFPITKITNKLDKELTGSITFECNMVGLDGKVILVSPDKMLLTTYNMYKKVVENVLQLNINELTNTINELNIIKDIKPILSIELKQHPDDIEVVIKNISTQLNTEEEIIKGLFEKYTIGRIFRIKTETESLQIKRKELQHNLDNSAKFIWDNKYNK